MKNSLVFGKWDRYWTNKGRSSEYFYIFMGEQSTFFYYLYPIDISGQCTSQNHRCNSVNHRGNPPFRGGRIRNNLVHPPHLTQWRVRLRWSVTCPKSHMNFSLSSFPFSLPFSFFPFLSCLSSFSAPSLSSSLPVVSLLPEFLPTNVCELDTF